MQHVIRVGNMQHLKKGKKTKQNKTIMEWYQGCKLKLGTPNAQFKSITEETCVLFIKCKGNVPLLRNTNVTIR
jgi:hypothetical protein